MTRSGRAQGFLDRAWNRRRPVNDADPSGLERGHLFRRGAGATRDDRPGVTHALARRGGLTGDETDHWFGQVLLDEVGGGLLVVAADLTDHDDGFGGGVGFEETEHVDERGADHGVAANTDGGALTGPSPGERIDN